MSLAPGQTSAVDVGGIRNPTRDPVAWVVTLFGLNFLFQRISVPNLDIPVTVPLTLAWLVLALALGVVDLHPRRLLLWLAAAAISALLVIPQLVLVANPFVSFNSWAFWMVVWLPLTVHLRDRSPATFVRALTGVAQVGVGLSVLSLAFVGSQLAGLPYRDWLGDAVPDALQVHGYVVSYPISYGSELYKSNGWIALEPSFLSFMLGVSLVCALAARLRPLTVLMIFIGLLSTTAGSGLAVLGVYVVAVVVSGRGALLRRFALPSAVVAVVFATTLLGESITSRLAEAGQPRSSTSLRAIEPYLYLWPHWINDTAAVFVGRGAGSSAWIVENSGVPGLLVTNLAKVLFDYGMVGGALLIGLMLSTFLRTPDPAIAVALAVSMLTLQTASPPLIACAFLVAGLWAPSPAGQRRGHVGAPTGPGFRSLDLPRPLTTSLRLRPVR